MVNDWQCTYCNISEGEERDSRKSAMCLQKVSVHMEATRDSTHTTEGQCVVGCVSLQLKLGGEHSHGAPSISRPMIKSVLCLVGAELLTLDMLSCHTSQLLTVI